MQRAWSLTDSRGLQAADLALRAVGALERMEANIGQVLSTSAECITTIHCLKVRPAWPPDVELEI